MLSQAVSVADPDETLPPLTTSAMQQLEKMVDMDVSDSSTDSVEDIFADEVEADNDPDCVPNLKCFNNSFTGNSAPHAR